MASVQNIYTIGYSGFQISDFCMVLRSYGIAAVIDVRSLPFSTWQKEYNRDALTRTLHGAGIYYRNYAREYGARQDNPQYLSPSGYLDYEKFSRSPEFLSGLQRLMEGMAQGYRFVLMCAEKEPIRCHRAILVARAFAAAGYTVEHIMPQGVCLSQAAFEHQLLSRYAPVEEQIGLFEEGLPLGDDARLRLAYQKCNEEIGWRPASSFCLSKDQLGHS